MGEVSKEARMNYSYKVKEHNQKDYDYKVTLRLNTRNKVEDEIRRICDELSNLLIEKNRAYGNSALEPVRVFSKSDNVEQLKVRIDDKLSRFVKGTEFPGDNDIDDLLGYLVLLKIALNNDWS